MPGALKRRRTNGAVAGTAGKARRAVTATPGRTALALVRKMMNQRERKAHITSASTTGVQVVIPLHDIAEGDTGGTRSGLAIVGKTLELSGSINPIDNAGMPIYIHVAVVVDKQQEAGAAPDFTSVWDSDPRSGVHLDRENIKRFTVLFKRRLLLQQANEQGGGGDLGVMSAQFNAKLSLRDIGIRYQSSSATSYQKSGVYLTYTFMHADGTTVSGPTLNYYSRLWFTDP